MYLLLHVTLLVVEAFQLTWQTDLFMHSTTISVRHFQRKKNTVQWNSNEILQMHFFKKWKCVFQSRGRETYSKHLVDPTVQISPLQIAVPRGLQMEIPWYLPVKPLGWENSAWNAALSGKGNVYMLCDSTVRSKADAVTSSWTQLSSSRRVWLLKWAFQGQRHIFKINVIYRNCVLSLMYL